MANRPAFSPSEELSPEDQAVIDLIQPTEKDFASLVPCIRVDCDGGLPYLHCVPNMIFPDKSSFWVQCPKCGAGVCTSGSFADAIEMWIKSFNFARRVALPTEDDFGST